MANTAAQLGNLLSVQADINYYTQMSIYWNAKYEANQEKLEQQVKYFGKWEDAYDSAMNNSREITACHNGCQVVVVENNSNEALAENYAFAKVWQYDSALSEELSDLDIEYDTMKTMYDTLLEELRAQEEKDKQATSTAAQDTGLLQG